SELPLPPRRKTIAYMESMKREAKPIVCLTAYDYPTGLSIRSADVDLCLVGDSLANVALGHSTTQSISLDVMIHHAQAVQRGLNSSMLVSQPHLPASPFLVVDMPFGSFMASESEAIRNAVKLIQETGADAVKIEGGEEILGLVRKLTQFGIPVMGHIGLQPQRVGSTSGYRVQGRSAVAAAEIYHQARELEKAGCFSIVLECIPWKLAEFITENLSITTIGIGAGNATDGQVLVVSDMIGELTSPAHILAGLSGEGEEASRSESSSSPPPPSPASHSPSPPKFVRSFTKPWSLGAMRISAIRDYVEAVRERRFPENDVEGYKIKPAEFQEFLEIVE
ncbi:ketopantoate hydroxymethyltransferase, partial [Violaceomyces palustris]